MDDLRGQVDDVEVDVEVWGGLRGLGEDSEPGWDEVDGVFFDGERWVVGADELGAVVFIDIKPPEAAVEFVVVPGGVNCGP